jgi:hypothetical protein
VDTGKAIVIAGCWFSLALIASVYMIVFAGKVGDVLFGVFLPVGVLVLIGLAVTFFIPNTNNDEKPAK